MAKVKTDSIDEKVFSTTGSKIDEAAILSTGSESASSGFDPHFITEKIIEFGMALTGMPLYDYQKDSAYRIIHSVVAKEGETITMLFSRQSGKCFVKGTMVQTYDFGKKVIKPVEEICNGDYVVSPNNLAVEVMNCHNGMDEIFTVVPQSDFLHKPYGVNSKHILAVYDLTDNSYKNISIGEYLEFTIEHKMKLRGYARTLDFSENILYRFNIIPNGKGEYFGFEVDSNDKLFLLEDYTVVHNSETMAFVIDTLCVILPVLGKVIPELAEFKTGFRVGLFAPQSDQVTTTYQRAMSRLKSSNAAMVMEDADIDTKLIFDARLVLSNGSSLMGQTAAKTSKIESKTYDLIIIEEAQDTDDLVVSKCFHEDTKMLQADGTTKTIKEVVENKLNVIAYTDKILREVTPIEYHYNGVRDVYEIVTKKSTVTVTDNHRLYVREDLKTLPVIAELKDICKGCYISLYCKESSDFIDWVKITDIVKKPKAKTYCITVDTKEHLVVADGFIVHNSIESMAAACVHVDTEIKLLHGKKVKAKDIVVGDIVRGYDFTKCCISYGKVSWCQPPCKKVSYRLIFTNGIELLCSFDHPILVNNNGMEIWVETENLTLDSYVKISKSGVLSVTKLLHKDLIGEVDVANFTVDGINTYLANGVVTHNTFGTFVKLGTTGMRKGDFWYEIQRNIKRSTGAHKGKLRYHFEFNYLEIIKQKRAQYAKDGNLFHLNYEKFIKKQIEKRGIQSDSFKLAFALIWALEGGMFLSDTDWNNMLNRKKSFVRVVEPNWDIRAGIDIAKDRASTVITIGRIIPEFVGVPPRKEVLQWVELGGMDYEMQHQAIVQTLIDYGVGLVYIDYTGVGKPVVDRLVHAIGHFITVVPYTFSRPTKSEMWLALQADILAKRFVIPATQQARDSKEYKNAEIQFKGLTKRYEGGYLVAEKGSEHELDDYCLSIGTEILTSTGFKNYSELTMEDLVANYGIMDNSITYSNPLRIICKEYKGNMVRLVGEHIEFNITENHKVPLLRRTSNGKVSHWVSDVVMSQDLLRIKQSNISSRMFPHAGFVNGNSDELPIDAIRLLAYMVTEGWRSVRINCKGECKYRYSVAQSYKSNYENCVEMERVFDSIGLTYSIHDKKDGMRFYQFKSCDREYFDALLYRGMHVFPTDVLYSWSKDKLLAFYEALMNADGAWSRKTYSNKNLDFIKGFQLLCHLIGKGCTFKPRDEGTSKFTYIAYVFENAHLHSGIQKRYAEYYEGSVWCVTVKSGFIVTRLNGKIGVTGNCDSSALFVMSGNAELTASTNVEFSDENPFYQNAGVLQTIQTTSW